MLSEPADVHLPDVHARFALDYPLGHYLAHASGAGYPMGVEPRRHEEPSHVGLAQDELAVRSEGLGPVGELDHFGVPDSGNPGARGFEQRGEPAPVGLEELVVEVRRDAVEREGRGVPAVASGLYVALVGAKVDQVVGVSHGWEVRRDGLFGLHVHVLVLERDERHVHPDEFADLWCPDARGVDHHLRPNGAVIRDDLFHAPVINGDPGHPNVGVDLSSSQASTFGQGVGEGARIYIAVGRIVSGAQHTLRVEEREEFECLLGRDELQRESEGFRAASELVEFLHAVARGDQSEASDLLPAGIDASLLLQAPVQIDAVHIHPGKGFRGPELTYQARRVEGGAVGELALLQEHHVLPTRFHQMVGDTRASHPTTDDHGLRLVLQQSSLLSAYLVSIGCYANLAVYPLQLAVRLAFIKLFFLTLTFGVLGVGT